MAKKKVEVSAVALEEVRPARPTRLYEVSGKYLPTLRVRSEDQEGAWQEYCRITKITKTSNRVQITEVQEEI